MRDLLSRLAIAAASILLAGMGCVFAVGFFCYAIYLQLASMMEPPLAAVLTALAILFFCVLVMLAARLMMRGGRKGFAYGEGDPAMEIGRRIGEEAHAFVKGHKRGTLLASLLAGFAIGASPKLRAYLRDLLGL